MKKKIPDLKSEKEVHSFWSKHSVTDYLDDMEEIDQKIRLNPDLAYRIRERTKKKLIAIRLEKWQLKEAKAIAAKKHIPYQHLIRFWITQGLKQEAFGK